MHMVPGLGRLLCHHQVCSPPITSGRTLYVRVCFHIIRNARIENVGRYQSCMVYKLRIIWKQVLRDDRAAPQNHGDGAAVARRDCANGECQCGRRLGAVIFVVICRLRLCGHPLDGVLVRPAVSPHERQRHSHMDQAVCECHRPCCRG